MTAKLEKAYATARKAYEAFVLLQREEHVLRATHDYGFNDGDSFEVHMLSVRLARELGLGVGCTFDPYCPFFEHSAEMRNRAKFEGLPRPRTPEQYRLCVTQACAELETLLFEYLRELRKLLKTDPNKGCQIAAMLSDIAKHSAPGRAGKRQY